MGAMEIVAAAKQIDGVVFRGLSCTTVKSWIDRTGDRPKWTYAVMKRIDHRKNTGHKKGGQCGVLVHKSICIGVTFLNKVPLSHIAPMLSKRSRIFS